MFYNHIPNIQTAYAENTDEKIEQEFQDNIDNILGDIDTGELDDYLINDYNLDFFDVNTFKDLAIKVLSGTYFEEYDSLFDAILSTFKNSFKDLMKLFLMFLAIVFLYEMFSNFCVDKYFDIKKIVKLIFSFVIILILLQMFKSVASDISYTIEKIFSFSKLIFPILLNLILLSGANESYSVYSSLSLFLINTGSYLFSYFLLPLSISIFLLSLFGSVFSTGRFSKIIDLFKTIFKYSLMIFFALFGLFSSVNLFSSGMKDGVSLKLTKFAIKNYIPIIGGYISQGFDFVHSCSVVIKNAFGVCGIFILVFIILKPLLNYFIYCLFFKLLSAVVSLVGNSHYSDVFDNVSKTMSYFISVLIGLFFLVFIFMYLLIISISVV